MNEANRWNWDKPLQEYVTALQTAQVSPHLPAHLYTYIYMLSYICKLDN